MPTNSNWIPIKNELPGKKNRDCLKCGNEFNSEGPSNRICPKCTHINKTLRTVSVTKQALGRSGGVKPQ